MIRSRLYLSVASVIMMFSGGAFAQETQICEGRELVRAGTFEAVGKTAGVIIGARWGGGTLTLDDPIHAEGTHEEKMTRFREIRDQIKAALESQFA